MDRSRNFEKGRGAEECVSATSSFKANAHNELYNVPFIWEKGGFLKNIQSQWGRPFESTSCTQALSLRVGHADPVQSNSIHGWIQIYVPTLLAAAVQAGSSETCSVVVETMTMITLDSRVVVISTNRMCTQQVHMHIRTACRYWRVLRMREWRCGDEFTRVTISSFQLLTICWGVVLWRTGYSEGPLCLWSVASTPAAI